MSQMNNYTKQKLSQVQFQSLIVKQHS